jgi:hypothetical protein
MMSLAGSMDCVSLRMESAAVLSADAADTGFPFGANKNKYQGTRKIYSR